MPRSLVPDIPFIPSRYTFKDARLYLVAALFAAGNLFLPMAVHAIPDGGRVFLPLFFFTLVAAYAEGLTAGVLVAVASPLLNHVWTGMPTAELLPAVLFKSLFLAVVAASLSHRLGRIRLSALAAVVLATQVVGALVEGALIGDLGRAVRAATLGVPGMVFMVLGGYALLRWLAAERAKRGTR